MHLKSLLFAPGFVTNAADTVLVTEETSNENLQESINIILIFQQIFLNIILKVEKNYRLLLLFYGNFGFKPSAS